MHHKLGHRVQVSLRTFPVSDKKEIIVGAVEVFIDNSSSLKILEEFEKLRQEAYLDPLTGVGNRRYGDMFLQTRMYEWQKQFIQFGVIFLDIDHFKLFNDTYGHKTGDDVLVLVARSISNSLRTIDTLARWGGEEFLVILPAASTVIIKAIAERIRILIENSFIIMDNEKLQVTISIGATMSVKEDTIDSVISRADSLMFISKTAGRNRVTID